MIVLLSYAKHKETLIVTNVIALVSVVESIGILAQIGLSFQMGIFSTFGLSMVSGVFLYGSNAFFTLVYMKQVGADLALKYWNTRYKPTNNLIKIAGGLCNFKVYRLIYGKLFGKDRFNAAFDDPQVFFKPFTLISVFAIITSVLPILVGNICGLIFIEYGYQLQMNCIELSVIEVALVIL